jgi:hypothetical protein
MTFEQTMHTIESHLKALQADYDRLLEENNQLKKEKAGWGLWGTPYNSSKGMPKAPKNTEWKR